MAVLQTIVPITPCPNRIRFSDPVILVGSCFTEHIGAKLSAYKYNTQINPFGILYNPVSIARSIQRIALLQYYAAEELVQFDGMWHSLDHHGSFSGADQDNVLQTINTQLDRAHAFLKQARYVFFSPGTSHVFRYNTTGEIAGNNHKIPAPQFSPERLTVNDCVNAFSSATDRIHTLSPGAMIIWTVSPVRHIRDGLVQSQRSKSVLLLAMEELLRLYPDTFYFPAYEIMMDELRDYRYYDRDMLHPSALAVDLIWEKFVTAYLHPDDLHYHPRIEQIQKSMAHRLLTTQTEKIREFAGGQLELIEALARELPDLDWQAERMHFFRMMEPD